eukprot:TRINITY_DN2789_c0_g1_i2.p1 TRINITY_DN2789_c0_g1~~TRINITY_DN2789_c0_g1_i2.p1  ORF type:complete len:1294 (+),score=463.84 TRINITY_DN2789_c0_g1_i2:112-3882(+)
MAPPRGQRKMLKLVKKSTVSTSHKQLSLCREGRVWGEGKGSSVCCYKVTEEQVIRSGEFAVKSPVAQDAVTCVAVCKTGDKGFVGLHSGRLSPFSPSSTTDCTFAAHSSRVTCICLIEKQSKTIVWSSSADGFIKIWEGSKAVSKATGHRGEVTGVIHVPFASGGGIMWSYGIDKTIRVWDKGANAAAGSGSSRRAALLKCNEAVTGLVADEAQGVVWSSDKQHVKAWSADTRNCVWTGTRGGSCLTVCGEYIATVSESTHVALWPLQLPDCDDDTEFPPLAVLALPDKHASRLIPIGSSSLLAASDKALTLLAVNGLTVNPDKEILLEKTSDESVGAIFLGDSNLLLERVEPGSSAERCGAARFLGWQLVQVNHTPVSTVGDVRTAVRKQSRFIMTFQNVESEQQTRHAPLVRRTSSRKVPAQDSSARTASAPPAAPGLATAVHIPELHQLKQPHHGVRSPSPNSLQPPSVNSQPLSPTPKKAAPFSKGPKKVVKKAVRAAPVESAAHRDLVEAAKDIAGTSADDDLANALRRAVHNMQQRHQDTVRDLERKHAEQAEAYAAQLEERDSRLRDVEADGMDRLKHDLEDSFKKILDPSINQVLGTLRAIKDPQVAAVVAAATAASVETAQQEAHAPSEQHSPTTQANSSSNLGTSRHSVAMESLLTRCGDALSSLCAVQNTREWAQPPEDCTAEERAEALLKGLRALHAELCHSKDTTGKEVMQQAVLLSAQTILSERGDRSFEAVPSARSISHTMSPMRRSSAEHTTPMAARSRSHISAERHAPPPLPESRGSVHDSASPSPSPINRDLVPAASVEEDAHWGRLFEVAATLHQWLEHKPEHLHDIALQVTRDAAEKGASAVDNAIQAFGEYLQTERRTYEGLMTELEEGFVPGSPGEGTADQLREGWAQLEDAEERYKAMLEKMQRDYRDSKEIVAELQQKLSEFRTFVEEADQILQAAVSQFQSNNPNDSDLCHMCIQCVALHTWCKSRQFEPVLGSHLEAQLEYVTDPSDRARIENEATSVLRSWDILAEKLATAAGLKPASETDGHIEFVWVLLELCNVALDNGVTPDLASSSLDRIMNTVLPAHQQMIIRMNDIDVDDDTLPALETLCDEIGRVYSTVFQPVLVNNGVIASKTDDLSIALVKGLQHDCKLRSHHVPRYQLDPTHIAAVLHKYAQQEISPNALGLTPPAVDELLGQSLTKGGTVVILNSLGRLAAFHLLKINHERHYAPTDETPRSSLSSLVSFFKNRLGAR